MAYTVPEATTRQEVRGAARAAYYCKGASFGELALLHNEPRTATLSLERLFAALQAHLAVLEADDYAQLRDHLFGAQIEWKVSLLRRAPLLSQLDR